MKSVIIFYHVGGLDERGRFIVSEQMRLLKSSGLYDFSDKIFAGVVGHRYAVDWLTPYEKVELAYYDEDPTCYESKTLIALHEFVAKNIQDDYLILYFHTKGAFSQWRNNCKAVSSWRQVMGYWLIQDYRRCLELFEQYNLDTLGGNSINSYPTNVKNKKLFCEEREHAYHYSGNFWWATPQYIRRLKRPQVYTAKQYPHNHIHLRLRCENWVLSLMPSVRAGECFRYGNNLHPYQTPIHADQCNSNYFRLLR